MNRDRLKRLADFTRTIPPQEFNIQRLMHSSDSCGCALSRTPEVFPDLVRSEAGFPRYREARTWGYTYESLGVELFGLTPRQTQFLFGYVAPGQLVCGSSVHSPDVTPVEVADHIERFLTENPE